MSKREEYLLLGIIVVAAFLLRVWGIDFGLPYLYHADEPNKVVMAQNLLKTKDLNPHYFLKLFLFIYPNALTYPPHFLIGKVMGLFQTPADITYPVVSTLGVGKTEMPSTVLMGRLLTATFVTLSVALAHLVAKRAYDASRTTRISHLPNLTRTRFHGKIQ